MKINFNLRAVATLLATLTVMACAGKSAQAGSYVVSYSGGNVIYDNNGSTGNQPFQTSSTGFYYNQSIINWGT